MKFSSVSEYMYISCYVFSEEKAAELKIRLEQAEKAKEVSSSTLQERIHRYPLLPILYSVYIIASACGLLHTSCFLMS